MAKNINNNQIFVERETFEKNGRTFFSYFIKGNIRGKDVKTASAYLMQTPKAASEPLMKLLKSACANAENNFGMDPAKLVVSEVFATPGPILKRMMPRAQGRAYRINKRTSHVTLAVTEKA
mgnify:CR=1 FL=1